MIFFITAGHPGRSLRWKRNLSERKDRPG